MNARSLFARRLSLDAFNHDALDPRVVRLPQIHAKERADDAAVTHDRPPRRDVDSRRIGRETAAFTAVDVESFDRHVVGSHAQDASAPGPDETRPSLAD